MCAGNGRRGVGGGDDFACRDGALAVSRNPDPSGCSFVFCADSEFQIESVARRAPSILGDGRGASKSSQGDSQSFGYLKRSLLTI